MYPLLTMTPWLKHLAIAGPPCLIPLSVILLARQHTESPFGNAFDMLGVSTIGIAWGIAYVAVAAFLYWKRRGTLVPWILGAGIAISPILYFVAWNVFFRR